MFSASNALQEDKLTKRLESVAQHILIVVFGLLPIFFIPAAAAPFLYSKVVFVIGGLALAFLLYSFVVLRRGSIRFHFSPMLMALWGVAGVALLSAFISRDIRDALIGNTFEVHTALFMVLLAFVPLAWSLISADKNSIIRFYILLSISTILLSIFHILRLIVGADTLSLGFFGNSTATPIGGWNDLAIFLGLTIILSLVALTRLPSMTNVGKGLFAFTVAASVVMLSVINFAAVWFVLGFVSLLILIQNISRPHFQNSSLFGEGERTSGNVFATGIAAVVFAFSCVFIIGGTTLEGAISNVTDVSYIEVRPSFSATTGIAEEVYKDRAFFGVGPNKFVDAWRLHKDVSINTSLFWNTNFTSGFGYIPTNFVTMGIVGGAAWLLFLGLFVFTGFRMLFKASSTDHLWHFIGISSFVTGLYLWGLTLFYVPGPTILLLAVVCTGILSSAYAVLVRGGVKEYNINQNRTIGFLVLGVVVAVIIGAIATLYFAGRHYASVYTFNQGVLQVQTAGISIEEAEQSVAEAYLLSENDRFARRMAEYQLVRMNAFFNQERQPTDDDRALFQAAFTQGVAAAEEALVLDRTDVANWVILGNLYANLVPAGVEGSFERAQGAYEAAFELDPKNPTYLLRMAELAYGAGSEDRARALIGEALALKPNYSEAIFLLSQIDIANGNIAEAINAVRQITRLEPQNPVRFYQLGVLEYSRGSYQEAFNALARAVVLNENYANARYFLALTLDQLGEKEAAKGQLEYILALDPENTAVQALITQLEDGGSLTAPQTEVEPIEDAGGVEADGSAVITTQEPDTPLVTPVNTSEEEN